MKNFLCLFLCLLSLVGCLEGFTQYIDVLQKNIILGCVIKPFFSNQYGRLLVLGVLDNAIEDLRLNYPLLSIESMEEKKEIDKNQYDAIIVCLALEKDPHRELKTSVDVRCIEARQKGDDFLFT
jgi:hypothetical protein